MPRPTKAKLQAALALYDAQNGANSELAQLNQQIEAAKIQEEIELKKLELATRQNRVQDIRRSQQAAAATEAVRQSEVEAELRRVLELASQTQHTATMNMLRDIN